MSIKPMCRSFNDKNLTNLKLSIFWAGKTYKFIFCTY